jgi:flagellar protein FlaG
MLIQNIGSAASAPGLTGNSGPAPVATPTTQAAPVELPQQQAAQPQPTDAQLKNAVDNINHAMQQSNSSVEFSIDQSTKQTVVKVMDTQTGQLISQFPSKSALAVSQMIEQAQPGALVTQKA